MAGKTCQESQAKGKGEEIPKPAPWERHRRPGGVGGFVPACPLPDATYSEEAARTVGFASRGFVPASRGFLP